MYIFDIFHVDVDDTQWLHFDPSEPRAASDIINNDNTKQSIDTYFNDHTWDTWGPVSRSTSNSSSSNKLLTEDVLNCRSLYGATLSYWKGDRKLKSGTLKSG